MDGANCTLHLGEVAVLDGGAWLMPDGTRREELTGCDLQTGSAIRIGLRDEAPRRRRKKRMDPQNDAAVSQVVDDGASHDATMAHTTDAPADLSTAVSIAGDNPMLALALGVLAVVGSGAGFKLWSKRSEQAHEQAMKRLEIEANAPTTQPPPCQAAQAATEARLSAIEARMGKVEQSTADISAHGSEELEERVGKLEASMRRMGVKPPATKARTK